MNYTTSCQTCNKQISPTRECACPNRLADGSIQEGGHDEAASLSWVSPVAILATLFVATAMAYFLFLGWLFFL